MNTKRIRLLAFAAALVLILTVAVRVGIQAYKNELRIGNFSYNNIDNAYKNGTPLHEMDLSRLRHYLNIATVLLSRKAPNTVELPRKIVYYTQQNGTKVPALELPKGTTILWRPTKELYDLSLGYGCQGYPTYEKGWRYAQPFMISGKETDYTLLPFYYVKTFDLESVAYKAVKSNKSMRDSLADSLIPVRYWVFTYTRFIDDLFYEKGVFLSPDITQPNWDLPDTIMISLATALFLLTLYLQKKIEAYCSSSSQAS
jgi:hypothetical protein